MSEQPEHLSKLKPAELESLNDLVSSVPGVVKQTGYSEIYAHDISVRTPSTDAILLKFLSANKYVVPDTRQQLIETLNWRKTFNPLSAAFKETHDARFDGLGFITEDKSKPDGEVITWNLYGQAAAKPDVVFGDLDKFVRWRVGVMERGLQLLDFTSPRTQISQVHDYANVSFLRMDPNIKKASRAAIAIFQKHYPELLGKKYFVNVPLIMGWMFTAMKLIVSRETMQKFVVLSYASYLAEYTGPFVPEVYGGTGSPLAEQDVSASISLPAGYEVPATAPEPKPVEDGAEPSASAVPETEKA